MRLRLDDAPERTSCHATVVDLTCRQRSGPIREHATPATVIPLFRSRTPNPGPAA